MKQVFSTLFCLLAIGSFAQAAEIKLKDIVTYPLGAAIKPDSLDDVSPYADTVKTNFNSVTAEYGMKFGSLQPQQGKFDFKKGDMLVNWAKANNMRVHGHALIWALDKTQPAWLRNYQGSKEDWKNLLHNHIKTVATYYRGKVASWDVVNEALTAKGALADNLWLRNIGPEYIPLAFKWAHQYDPEAVLFYNDYGQEYGNKTDGMFRIADDVKAATGITIGFGFQFHTDSRLPEMKMRESIAKLAARGHKIHFSELEVGIKNVLTNPVYGFNGVYTKELQDEQSEKYYQIFDAYNQIPKAQRFGITTWGVGDGDFFLNDDPAKPRDFPLFFDFNYQPKYVYKNLIYLLQLPRVPVPTGEFTLSSKYTGLCVDVKDGSLDSKAMVVQNPCNGSPSQIVQITMKPNNMYTLSFKHSGLCLTNVSKYIGEPASQRPCTDAANQLFSIRHDQLKKSIDNVKLSTSNRCLATQGSDANTRITQNNCEAEPKQTFYYQAVKKVSVVPTDVIQLKNVGSSKCIELAGAASANAVPAIQYRCSAQSNQGLTLVKMAEGKYQIKVKSSGKCLDVPKVSLSDGAQIQQYTCGDASKLNQLFSLQIDSMTKTISAIKAEHSGKCLAVADASSADSAKIVQTTCASSNSQKWSYSAPTASQTSLPTGYVQLNSNHSYKCAQIIGSAGTDGMPLAQKTCGTSTAQKFKFVLVKDNQYKIMIQSSGKCLDIYKSLTADGTKVQQWSCGKTLPANRLFTIVHDKLTGSISSIKSVATGKCLSIKGSSTSEDSVIEQVSCGAGKHQSWRY